MIYLCVLFSYVTKRGYDYCRFILFLQKSRFFVPIPNKQPTHPDLNITDTSCKPNSVPRRIGAATIYLALSSLTGSKRSTRLYSDERHTICVNLHPMRFAMHTIVTNYDGELLPHLFTFTLQSFREGGFTLSFSTSKGSLFSVALSVSDVFQHQTLPVRKHGSCWCSDFPYIKFLQTDARLPGNLI